MTGDPSKPPFAPYRAYYIALKIAVLVVVAWLAWRYLGLMSVTP